MVGLHQGQVTLPDALPVSPDVARQTIGRSNKSGFEAFGCVGGATDAMATARNSASRVRGGAVCSLRIVATTTPTTAECTSIDRWPSFTEAARSAKRIVVGEVVQSYADDSADNAIEFRVRVDERLRGKSVRFLEFRGGTKSGAPLKICPADSILRVRVGDVIAFAFDARVASSPDPVLAVAWVRGTPHPFLMPGAEVLTLQAVRELAALPMTDTLPLASRAEGTDLPVLPLLAGAVSLLAVLIRPRRRIA